MKKLSLLLIFIGIILLFLCSKSYSQVSKPIRFTIDKEKIDYTERFHDRKISILQRNYCKSPAIKRKATCPESLSEWAGYSGTSLIQQLKQITENNACLGALYLYDSEHGPRVFSNDNIQAVAKEMYDIAPSYRGTGNSGMLGLLIYLNAASYHELYHPEEIQFNENARFWYIRAAETFALNIHLFDLSYDALIIFQEYLYMCNYTGLRHKPFILNMIKRAMRNLIANDNWRKVINDPYILYTYAYVYNNLFYIMYDGITLSDSQYETAIYNDKEYIELLYLLGIDVDLNKNSTLKFLTSNAVGELSRMLESQVLKPLAGPYLAEVAKTHNRLTPNWYRAIEGINNAGICSQYNLCEDMNAVKIEVENMLFPNNWIFDDGKLIVKTPLSYDDVLPLYYSTKQVQAQFFRFIETDIPLPDEPNTMLNAKIYGSRDEYVEWQQVLYDLPTNNGGIYIEKDATFYTYERPSGSSSTVEELFRHEYVHYLQGQYLIAGDWGTTAFFNNERLTWFVEGMAELFAGSTDVEGVRIRESRASAIQNDGVSNYMTVSEILSSTYQEGFTFYRYSNMLWAYWFNYDKNTVKELTEYLKIDNITAFDHRVNELKHNESLQQDFQVFLNNEVIDPANWWPIYTPYPDDTELTIADIDDIRNEFEAITGIHDGTSALDASEMIRRFSLTGAISGINWDESLNNIMIQLKNDPDINNFDYIVGYYKDVTETGATFVITGPLKNTNAGYAGKNKPTDDLNILEKNNENVKFSVYPLPARDKLFLEIPPQIEVHSLTVLNNTGTVVMHIHTKPLTCIPVNRLQRGMYFLQVHTNGGIITVKFIKE